MIKGDQVLLAMKKRGFGAGKWNGVGGKLKEGETVEGAAQREIQEEIGVEVELQDIKAVGTLRFDFVDNPGWANFCHVFTIAHWRDEPTESEEMRPQWYAFDKIPFGEMWVDDPHWLPLVLAGKKVKGEFLFDKTGGSMMDFSVVEIE